MNCLPRLKATASRSALAALLLTAMPALQAGEHRATPEPSPYRLVSGSLPEAPLRITAAPYQLDPRYRIEPGGAAKLADKPYARQIDAAAREAGLDPALVHAVVAVESAYQPAAVSPKGAVGLMQLLPETALRYGVSNPARVDDNLRAGTQHLRGLMQRFDNRIELVLAAYNAGEGAVKRYNNTIPPYSETRNYVPAVISKYQAGSSLPVQKAAAKPVRRNYLPGTRLDSVALSTLR
jgi:soluble lytic murein transglycosylase-like protein